MPIFYNAFDAIIYCNYRPAGAVQGFGWSMIYHLLDQDWPTAVRTAEALAEALSFVLGQNCWIEWADVRNLKGVPSQLPIQTTPLTALPQWGPPDNAGRTLLWRQTTLAGDSVSRHFHGIPDEDLQASEWAWDGMTLPTGPVARPVFPALVTKVELWEYAMAFIRDNTCLQRQLDDTPTGQQRWHLERWDNVEYVRPSFQWVGHEWRRVSWESDVYADSPAFTPCGSAVSVLHTCYSAPCTFYVGDSGRVIRYYWSAPGAAILDTPTVFWGWAKDKKIAQPQIVGEIPGKGLRTWSAGLSWGVAPAVGVDGSPADFMGNTPLTPALEAPLAPGLLPGCDMPAPVPIHVHNVDSSVSNPNVTEITIGNNLSLTIVATNHVRIDAVVPAPPPPAPLPIVAAGTPSSTSFEFTNIIFGNNDVYELREIVPGYISIDLGGDWYTFTVLASPQLAFDPGRRKRVAINLATPLEIRGIKGVFVNQELRIFNLGTAPITLVRDITVVFPARRIDTPQDDDWLVAPGGSVGLVLTGAAWQVVDNFQGRYEPSGTPESDVLRWGGHAFSPYNSSMLVPSSMKSSDTGVYFDGHVAARIGGGTLTAGELDPEDAPIVTLFAASNIGRIVPKRQNHVITLVVLPGGLDCELKDYSLDPDPDFHRILLPSFTLKSGCAVTLHHYTGPGSDPGWYIHRPSLSFNFAWTETPTGLVDGVNGTFGLAHTPLSGRLMLFVNGVLQREGAGNDFVLTGASIVFELGAQPASGSAILATYQY